MDAVERRFTETRTEPEPLRIPITEEQAAGLASLQAEVEEVQGRLNSFMSGVCLGAHVVRGEKFQILNTSPPMLEISGAVMSAAKSNGNGAE